MNKRVGITYNLTGQVLEFYPPEWREGTTAAAATYKVYEGVDDLDNDAEFSGTATDDEDTVDTTLSAAAGYAQSARNQIAVASATGITPGIAYVLAEDSAEELVRPVIVDGTTITLDRELKRDYTTAATLKGLRQSFTIDATFVATESKINHPHNPYRVEWSYTIGGIARKAWTEFDLVRVAQKHGVTGHDLIPFLPDVGYQDSLEARGQWFAHEVDEGYRMVVFDLRSHGIHIDQVREQGMLDELVKRGALLILARGGRHPADRDPDAYVDESMKYYQGGLVNAVAKIARDQSLEGGIDSDPSHQLMFRR